MSVAEELSARDAASGTAPELTAAGADIPGAVIRSSGGLLTTGYKAGAGPHPWPRSGPTKASDAAGPALSAPTAITGIIARSAEASHRGHFAFFALARAGLLSSRSTAPPSFQSV